MIIKYFKLWVLKSEGDCWDADENSGGFCQAVFPIWQHNSWLLSLSDVVTRGGEGVGGGELDEVSQKEQNSICKINKYQGCNV